MSAPRGAAPRGVGTRFDYVIGIGEQLHLSKLVGRGDNIGPKAGKDRQQRRSGPYPKPPSLGQDKSGSLYTIHIYTHIPFTYSSLGPHMHLVRIQFVPSNDTVAAYSTVKDAFKDVVEKLQYAYISSERDSKATSNSVILEHHIEDILFTVSVPKLFEPEHRAFELCQKIVNHVAELRFLDPDPPPRPDLDPSVQSLFDVVKAEGILGYDEKPLKPPPTLDFSKL